MRTLIFNSTNVLQGTKNSTYRYNFPVSVKFEKGDKVALQSILLPYSWYNINASLYNNNTFQIYYMGQTTTLTIPDGFYSLDDLNYWLHSQYLLPSNNLPYLVDNNGTNVYYGQFSYNTPYYSVQWDAFKVPSELPEGWTNPSEIPLSGVTLQLIIENNNFGKIIGFSMGSYPPEQDSTETYSTTSALQGNVPNLSPVNSLVLQCSLCNNDFAVPSKLLYSFSPNTSFGSNIFLSPPQFAWINTVEGTYTNIDIVITDQNFQMIDIKDINVCIQLVVKSAHE
jgi:hypothetical protein